MRTRSRTVAAAIEETVASLHEIERRVRDSHAIAATASREAQTTDTAMVNLSEEAERIGEVVNTVAAIAGRTNRLARNAVEAAHGTQGVSSHVAQVPAPAGETGAAARQVMMAANALATQSMAVQREVEAFLSAGRTGLHAVRGLGRGREAWSGARRRQRLTRR